MISIINVYYQPFMFLKKKSSEKMLIIYADNECVYQLFMFLEKKSSENMMSISLFSENYTVQLESKCYKW